MTNFLATKGGKKLRVRKKKMNSWEVDKGRKTGCPMDVEGKKSTDVEKKMERKVSDLAKKERWFWLPISTGYVKDSRRRRGGKKAPGH